MHLSLVLTLALVGAAAPEGNGRALAPRGLRIPVDDFGYQLQGYRADLSRVRDSGFDLVVIDYSRWGDGDSEFPRSVIDAVRNSGPCGRRVVLAYMSIGEAEDYRYYWDESWIDDAGNPIEGVAPSFLGPTNPAWFGNYNVRYWDRAWQRILFGITEGGSKSYLDRIIDAGFDGVYMDIIDAFEYWGPKEIGGNDERRQAPRDMVDLVRRLARHARKTRRVGDFLVVPQNGANIIDPAAYPDAADPDKAASKQRRRYFKQIDAIGAEDTFFFGDRDENNKLDPQWDIIAWLDQFAAAGKTVLAIDYLTQETKIADFFGQARERSYVPYTSVRDLDKLTIPEGFPPTCN